MDMEKCYFFFTFVGCLLLIDELVLSNIDFNYLSARFSWYGWWCESYGGNLRRGVKSSKQQKRSNDVNKNIFWYRNEYLTEKWSER